MVARRHTLGGNAGHVWRADASLICSPYLRCIKFFSTLWEVPMARIGWWFDPDRVRVSGVRRVLQWVTDVSDSHVAGTCTSASGRGALTSAASALVPAQTSQSSGRIRHEWVAREPHTPL